MNLLWLDYQQAPPSNRIAGSALLVVGLAAGVALLGAYVDTRESLEAVEHRLAVKKNALERSRVLRPADSPETSQADRIVLRLSGNSAARWDSLLTSLEGAVDDSVTLLSLDPSEGEMSLSGEARNFAAAGAFARRLEETKVLTDVRLLGHETAKEHPQRPVRFSLAAKWGGEP